MTPLRWLLVVRLSPYAYFFAALIALVIGAAAKCSSCVLWFPWIFLIGALWFIAARIISYAMMADIARRVRTGEIPNTWPGGIPVPARPPDERRIRDSLDALDTSPDGAPAWVRPAVDEWLAASAGPEKDRMRSALLQRLYDEAGQPGDPAQKRALNDVRLAINPWVEKQ